MATKKIGEAFIFLAVVKNNLLEKPNLRNENQIDRLNR